MRRLALIVALFAASTAHADDMVFTQGDMTVRLTQAAGQVPIAEAVLPQVAPGATPKAALVTVSGREILACWVLDADGDIGIVDQYNSGGFIPVDMFKRSGV
jgi:hypothetical protein